MNKLFGNISVEEHEEKVVVVDITAEDVISHEENLQEIHDIEIEAAATVAAMEEGEKAVASLEEAAASYDAMLAQPESISPAHVLVAQENLRMTAVNLGVDSAEDLETICGEEVSLEDAYTNPVTGIEISRESVGDFIKKIIEQIKSFFKKVGIQVKKLYVKAVAYVNNTEKMAKKLSDEIEKKYKQNDNIKVSDSDKEKILNAVGIIGMAGNKEIGFKQLSGFHASANAKKYLERIDSAISELVGSFKVDSGKTDKLNAKTISAAISALNNATAKEASFFSDIVNKSKTALGLDNAMPKEYAVLPLKVSGKSIVSLVAKVDDEAASSSDELKQLSAISFSKSTQSLQKSDLDSVTIKPLSIKEIQTVLGNVNGKSSSAYLKVAQDIMDSRQKDAESYVKEFKTDEASSIEKARISKYISITQTTANSLTLDAILGNIAANKAILSACRSFAEMHGVEKKEEKKEEK